MPNLKLKKIISIKRVTDVIKLTLVFYFSNFLITLAGLPTANEFAGTSLVTTDPAPIVLPEPMVTPGQITVFPPIQQSLPMVMGLAI
jgi:hypothetical protein